MPQTLRSVAQTYEHFYEFCSVEAVGLGPPRAAVDFDAGGVDDQVLDPLGGEEAMEPEAVAAGRVSGEDRGVLGQAEARLGGLDLRQQGIRAAGRDRPEPGFLAQADGERQLPVLVAQLQSEVENRCRRHGRIPLVSRRHGKVPEKGL
jgi:hypothetical protein